MYIAILSGNSVFGGYSVVGTLESINEISELVDKLNSEYHVTLDIDTRHSTSAYHVYHNINIDNRDINLVVEPINSWKEH